ncbi:hypothetical protein VTJ49DRAFT_4627 [Mycothermus thermophilus]|uniref:Uncharacterized protein n=1 Tax=Humicola insolens TaxID=85995 RepID=A0ABR3V523_HUMIN
MADDPHNTSDISDVAEPTAPAKEDAETTAARRELKQTSISEKTASGAVRRPQDDDRSGSDEDAPKRKKPARRLTPPTTLNAGREEELKEQVSSPKKKRAHDELDESKDTAETSAQGSTDKAAGDSATPGGSQSRTDRSEPEKKRPRDRQASASAVQSGKEEVEPLSASASPRSSLESARPMVSLDASTTINSKPSEPQLKPASATAFANSAFGKLAASSTSPFGSFGGSGKPSLFGSSSASSSIFGSTNTSQSAAPAGPPKLSFGSTSSASPFATAATPANGQAGGSLFKTSAFASSPFGTASALSGPRLNFGKPGEVLKSDKPVKPFGAPDSDAEEKSGDEGSEEGDDAKGEGSSDEAEVKDEDKDESSRAGEDKKKPKLQKIVVDDGESEEVTLFSVRAKMYVMEKGVGWKERGAGMLKVNVPKATVELDPEQGGAPDPASFDASVLADEKEERRKHVRLIMRQDHTLRVILNTVLLPAMKFQVMNRLKASTVLFTAFEEGSARQVQVKLSEANANAFYQLVEMLKKRLADVYTEKTCPWPPYFTHLEKIHRALSLVATFLSARRQVAPTLDTLRPAVEGHIRCPLTVEDVAAVVALLASRHNGNGEATPGGVDDDGGGRRSGANTPASASAVTTVRFAYVDEMELAISMGEAERDPALIPEPIPTGSEEARQVLVFEFLDGELKREVSNKSGGSGGTSSSSTWVRDREDKMKMPVYSQAQMTKLIERRNAKFVQAVNGFVEGCVAQGLDPEMVLKDMLPAYVPQPRPEPAERGPLPGSLPATIPRERKSITEIVQELKDSSWYTGQIVPDGHRVFEAQEAVYGDLDFLLSQDLVNALYNARGITRFYAHQAEAVNALHAGHHVVVATSTSSGKSLIYQLPVLHALERDRDTRAMYIFPTKALAQDQRRSLKEMMAFMPGISDLAVETFDGDTPMADRVAIRDEARIIFTNPDMLHINILPNEERWRSFLVNLKYVVVDELHYYNGLLGSHVAFIMRRLRRICASLGNRHVKFISCSATVANPEEHFKTIFGIEDVRLVDFDGSPSGRKEFLCWNTPYKDPGDPASGRGNAMLECARLFCELILRGVRVIAFTRVREQCEKLVGAIKQELETLGRGEVAARVMGYRGGYTAQDRRRIETDMFEGKLLGIVATTALELGVDIGSLDYVLTWGFPYSIANLRQQSGRAGRRNKDSLSILVGDGFATDQYYMQNPDELFTKPNCALQVDLDNMLVKEAHLQCAAHEMPILPASDAIYFGPDLAQVCAKRLIPDPQGFYHCHPRFRPQPSRFVSIRDTEDDHFAIIDTTNNRNVVLEELEASRATFTIYDGAIFLHQGTTYLVRDFDPDRKLARVERVRVDWLTQQRDYTDVDPIETEAVKRIHGSPCRAYYGSIRIKQVVFGYFKVDPRRGCVLDAVQVDNPPVIRHSKGMWLDVPQSALDILAGRRLHAAAAIHAAQHALMSLIPNYVMSIPGDVRTECKSPTKEFSPTAAQSQRKRPARLTFYDAKGGAVAMALGLFEPETGESHQQQQQGQQGQQQDQQQSPQPSPSVPGQQMEKHEDAEPQEIPAVISPPTATLPQGASSPPAAYYTRLPGTFQPMTASPPTSSSATFSPLSTPDPNNNNNEKQHESAASPRSVVTASSHHVHEPHSHVYLSPLLKSVADAPSNCHHVHSQPTSPRLPLSARLPLHAGDLGSPRPPPTKTAAAAAAASPNPGAPIAAEPPSRMSLLRTKLRVREMGESGRSGIHPKIFLRNVFRSASFASRVVNVLWPVVPAAVAVMFALPDHNLLVFILSYLAMVPCANLIGFAGQELSRKFPYVVGIIAETTLGSLVEIIIFIVLITSPEKSGVDYIQVIQAAILGSILATMLLCLGLCFVAGGLRREESSFSEAVSEAGNGLLLTAGFGLAIPTVFEHSLVDKIPYDELLDKTINLSRATALLLMIAYFTYLFFQARTHHGIYDAVFETDEERDLKKKVAHIHHRLTFTECCVALAISIALVSIIAKALVDRIHYLVEERHVSDAFVGLILVPLVEKAAEHLTAIDDAYNQQMNFALSDVLGATLQTALFNGPLVVVVGWGLGKPMGFHFEVFDVVVLILSIITVGNFLRDQKSNYLEGALCVVVYVAIAVGAYNYPNPHHIASPGGDAHH